MNKMMNALILENFGDHEFKRVELPIPQPEAGQVLVRIHASGVNPIDYKIRLGEATYAMPELPAVLGTDMAGVVTAVGEGVTHFNVGDEVYGLMPNQVEDKKKILLRVRKIKGQTQAIEKALEDNVECGAILQQICSVRGAINGLMNEMLEVHLKDTLVSGETTEQQRKEELAEIAKILKSYLK
jgi:DNA-binding FrmR family transcriptional regulator